MAILLRLMSAALFAVLCSTTAFANFPERSVTIVVGTAPGGTQDILSRIVADGLSEKWGQPVLVVNRPGASSTIAADFVAHSPADGYTLFMAAPNIAAPFQEQLNYDPVESFRPVIELAQSGSLFLVSSTLEVETLADVIALARSRPDQPLMYAGGSGQANAHDLFFWEFGNRLGIEFRHVPYTGGSEQIAAVMGGFVDVTLGGVSAVALVASGEVKALAVTTPERHPELPDLPTIAEAADLPGFSQVNWFGILAPAETPDDVVAKLNEDMAAVMASPDVVERLRGLGMQTVDTAPETFAARIVDSVAEWSRAFQ